MDRSQKADSVASLNAVFNEVGVVVVTRNLGMSVGQSTGLRTKMREAGATYKVAKNSLASLALNDTPYKGLEDLLSGPTGLAWSTDPVAAAKAAVDFAKTTDKIEIVGGSMGGQLLDEAGSDITHIVKTTTYLIDPRYREPVYQEVGKWLKGVYPISTGLVVSALGQPQWLMEIDVIAVIPDNWPSNRA